MNDLTRLERDILGAFPALADGMYYPVMADRIRAFIGRLSGDCTMVELYEALSVLEGIRDPRYDDQPAAPEWPTLQRSGGVQR